MTDILIAPLLGLDETFPDTLVILHHPSSGKYACYCHDGIHGLASFSTEVHAHMFAQEINFSGMALLEVSFDEAREIAKGRPMPIVSLMLLDKPHDPTIHFVR
jgi:hypothetical protein